MMSCGSRIVTGASDQGGEAACFNLPVGSGVTAFLGLGTNVGDRAANLAEALHRLLEIAEIVQTSSVYETDPVGYTDQPTFWNMVAEIRTDLPARALMSALLEIEEQMGRERTFPNAPRIIDMDILLYDDVIVSDAVVTLPHPRMGERAFVLKPLAEIAPAAVDPRTGERYAERLQSKSLERAEIIAPPLRIMHEPD
jgi:2-amino-4-hydroxy-6-hydroxymethyldihydropteridine diphosphokinase